MANTKDYCKVINLEDGMPTADAAIRRLTYEIKHAQELKIPAIKLIHGYGSSGSGGKIRVKSRQYLNSLMSRGEISDIVIGENFSIFDEATRSSFEKCDALRNDSDLDRHNNGITIVIIKK